MCAGSGRGAGKGSLSLLPGECRQFLEDEGGEQKHGVLMVVKRLRGVLCGGPSK